MTTGPAPVAFAQTKRRVVAQRSNVAIRLIRIDETTAVKT